MTNRGTVQAIILTGGRSSRLGGRHKPGIVLGGRSVLDRILDTLWEAAPQARVVLAGRAAGASAEHLAECTVVREDPPFAGPLAGVAVGAAALAAGDGPVVLLGGDLPFVTAATLGRLLAALKAGAQVASSQDATGHLQYLVSAWSRQTLDAQLAAIGDPDGVPLRALFRGLEPHLVACDPEELRDIDTPEDLARAIQTSDGRPVPPELLAAVHSAQQDTGLSPLDAVAILEFARAVKHAPSAANPAVAAFIAGQRAGAHGSVAEALAAVLDVAGHQPPGLDTGGRDI